MRGKINEKLGIFVDFQGQFLKGKGNFTMYSYIMPYNQCIISTARYSVLERELVLQEVQHRWPRRRNEKQIQRTYSQFLKNSVMPSWPYATLYTVQRVSTHKVLQMIIILMLSNMSLKSK